MSQKFDVLLNVSSGMLSTLLQMIEGRCNLTQVQISRGDARIGYLKEGTGIAPVTTKEVGMSISPTAKFNRNKRYANGQRNKGISGQELVMEILGKEVEGKLRPWTYNEISQEFVNRGFARTTTSSTLWQMTNKKKVRFLGDGKYCLPGATVHLSAAGTN